MKKILPISILIFIIVAAGIYYFNTRLTTKTIPQQNTQAQGSTTQSTIVTFKTYTDQETGLTIVYPSQYTVEPSPAPSGPWDSRSLLIVDNNPTSTSTKASAVPLTVGVQRQPLELDGKIYHTIAEYQQSGTAAKMIQGVPNPNGDLITINGMQALLYHIPPAESTGIGGNSYFFIHDDLIYEIDINPNDPLAVQMLQSISWNK